MSFGCPQGVSALTRMRCISDVSSTSSNHLESCQNYFIIYIVMDLRGWIFSTGWN